ncbi:MAG TPA: SRPBCC family protein [Gemmatimonadaceae bacterium]|jgi:uncharacterized membrane protein|nr:SRPBCC family protein [Gemmatimonadaceae bacterium]
MVLATTGPSRLRHTTPVDDGRGSDSRDESWHNVADVERIGSVAIGAALVGLGLRRRDAGGIAAALIGSYLIGRGATGHCPVYRALGVSTGSADAVLGAPQRDDVTGRAATVNARKSVKVEHTVRVARARAELFEYWRDFENLPGIMSHLVAVRVASPTRSHWTAKAPAGRTVEWDAEIVNEVPDEIIAWKSVGDPDIPNAGSVNFRDLPAGGGTEVRVTIDYEPPAGRVGALLSQVLGEEPDRQIREDLQRFKERMEAGEAS